VRGFAGAAAMTRAAQPGTVTHTRTHTLRGTKSRWMMLLPRKRHAHFGWGMDGTGYAWWISHWHAFRGSMDTHTHTHTHTHTL